MSNIQFNSCYFQESLERNSFPLGTWRVYNPKNQEGSINCEMKGNYKIMYVFMFGNQRAYITGDRNKKAHIKITGDLDNGYWTHYTLPIKLFPFMKLKSKAKRLKKWGKRIQKVSKVIFIPDYKTCQAMELFK